MSSKACGEPTSELKMPPKLLDKDSHPDQVSTLTKLSTPLILTEVDPSAFLKSKETSNQEDTSSDIKRPTKFFKNSIKTIMDQ